LAFLLFTGACSTERASVTETLAANDQPVYEVPEGKKQKWAGIQTMVQKEHDVCIEHCGNDKTCEDKCAQVYKTRLDREYKGIMLE
jgi:hypothetical protein